MGEEPVKTKVPTVPDFIDEDFIQTLDANKKAYWAGRKAGRRGQEDAPKAKPKSESKGDKLRLDNEGNSYSPNRAVRHQKLPSDPVYTKKTHKMIKERKKNAPSKQQRKRAIAQARKARQENNSQIS